MPIPPLQNNNFLQELMEKKGIKFQIKSGNARYECRVQDRATYERAKTQRQNSTTTVSSSSTADSH